MAVADRIAEIDRPALLERIGARRVVLSVSGGKDSTAASLLLSELGIDHDRVHCLTGWDHPDTVRHVEGHLTERLGPIAILRPPLLMADLCRKKGMFPSRTRRFCTEELKVKPIARHLKSYSAAEPVNAVGIRAAESEARMRLPEWEWFDAGECESWRPVLRWSEAEVIEMHQRHDVLPCPLYLRGAARVGCWPCIFARKDEIRRIAGEDPGRIDEIRLLEREVADTAEARHAARGTTLKEEGHQRPTFFQAMGSLRSEGVADGLRDGRCVPIDDVVEWARTSRGGKQFEMFAAAGRDAGCMRWGLCELVTSDD